MTPLPVAFLVAISYTMANVDATKPDEVQAWTNNHEMQINGIMAGTMIGMAVLIIVIAAFLARPLQTDAGRRKRRDDEYDDYEGDEDRPRRRPRADDDDLPRKKRDDLDDRVR